VEKTSTSRYQEPSSPDIPHDRRKSSGCTLIELLVILWILVFGLTGAVKGMRFASQYGCAWSLVGAVLGFIGGIIVAIAILVLLILICQLISNFCKWYRPLAPTCPNQTCRANIGEPVETPLRLRKHIEGISHNAYRCKCGNLYAKSGRMTFNTRWMRILSDDTVEPCLKHIPFGRWKPDTADKIEIPADHYEGKYPIDIFTTKTLEPTRQAVAFFIGLSATLSIALILMMMFMKTTFPSPPAMVISFCALFLGAAGMTCVVTWEKGRCSVRSIQADQDGVRIQRFNKRWTEIQWTQITSAQKPKDSFIASWIFETPHAKITLNSEGLLPDDWRLLTDYIKDHVPPNCQPNKT
jgi:hypothetical protein